MRKSGVKTVANRRKNQNRDFLTPEEARKTIGGNLSFAAAEAYKLLRTNLNFSLPEVEGCKIIGVTSALHEEGKSTTAVNIAYTMAQTGQKVLLLEADMRLPALSKYLRVAAAPGLSNLLAGRCSGNDVLRKSGLLSNLWVTTAGEIPPNPAELLGSGQMEATIKAMSKIFDVIIVDLPPLLTVSDAVVVSRLVHGMILVVRQDYCDRKSIDEAIRQLRFADVKILGFVMTAANTQSETYRHYSGYSAYRESGR